MIIQQLLLTSDDDVLPIGGSSRKVAEEVATREHLPTRGWKLVRNADINIHSPLSTACDSVENLDSVDGDCPAVVDGNPGCFFLFCLAQVNNLITTSVRASCASINAVECYESVIQCR